MSRESSQADGVVPSIEVRLSADRQTATITGGEGHDQITILTALIAANIDDLLAQTKSAARMKHLMTQFAEAFLGLSEMAINRRIESVQYRLRSSEAMWRFVSDAMAADKEMLEVPASLSYAEVITRDLRNKIALNLARESDDTGVTTIPSAVRVGERVEKEAANRRCQGFARGMALQFFVAAINGK
jgi:hypothetical protein